MERRKPSCTMANRPGLTETAAHQIANCRYNHTKPEYFFAAVLSNQDWTRSQASFWWEMGLGCQDCAGGLHAPWASTSSRAWLCEPHFGDSSGHAHQLQQVYFKLLNLKSLGILLLQMSTWNLICSLQKDLHLTMWISNPLQLLIPFSRQRHPVLFWSDLDEGLNVYLLRPESARQAVDGDFQGCHARNASYPKSESCHGH